MRVLLTGAGGQLGSHLAPALADAGMDLVAVAGPSSGVDLADHDSTIARLDAADPGLVVHLAAISGAEAARLDPARAYAVNVGATRAIAGWCRDRSRRLLFASTDLVFDGESAPYAEDAPPAPLSVYGATKAAAEVAVAGLPGGLVARLSLLWGPARNGRPAFFDLAIAALRRGEPRAFFDDEFRTPLDLPTAAVVLRRLAESGTTGVVHVGGPERVSRFDLMRRVAAATGIDPALVRAGRRADAPSAEPRPADASLDTARLDAILPDRPRPSIESAAAAMAQ